MRISIPRIKSVKFSLDDALLFFEVFFVIQPAILTVTLDNILNYVLLGFLTIEILLSLRLNKASPLVLLLITFIIYQLTVTLVFHSIGTQTAIMKTIPSILTIIMLWRRLASDKERTIHVVAVAFWWVLFINFLSLVLFPGGLVVGYSVSLQFHRSYFLGVDNQFGKVFFPAIGIIWFDEEYRDSQNHLASISALAMVLLCYFIRLSAGGLFAAVLLTIIYCFYKMNSNSRFFLSNKIMFVVLIALYLGIVLGSALIYTSSTFTSLVSFVGKDTTLSGRTKIWAVCIKTFLSHPIFGIGWKTRDAVVVMSVPFSAHNRVLQSFIEGGIVGGVLLILLIVVPMTRSARIRHECPAIHILSISIFITFIYFMVETGTLVPFYMIVIIIGAITMSNKMVYKE